jgi:hypothetical protein
MSTPSVLAALTALRIPAPVARALAAEWPEMAASPQLDPEAWDLLWNHPARDASMARQLVARPLSQAQLSTVLRTERRAGVLREALRYTVPTADHWHQLAARPPSGQLSGELALDDRCPPELRERFLATAPAVVQIWPVAGAPEVTISQRLEALAALAPLPVAGWRAYNDAWRAVVAVWPESLPHICAGGLPKEAAVAAAGALGLIDPALQLALLENYADIDEPQFLRAALAANPAVTVAALEVMVAKGESLAARRLHAPQTSRLDGDPGDVSDPALLDRLVERALPTRFDQSRVRPWFAVALAGNPHLSAEQRAELADTLRAYAQSWDAPSPGVLSEVFARTAARLGAPGLVLSAQHPWVGTETPADDPEPQGNPDTIRATALGGPWWESRTAAATLVPLLGDDPDLWRSAVSLAADFPGTLTELVSVARALTC